jgi:hypothetical protein
MRRGGTVGGGEAYMRGFWRTDDLTALVRIFVANRDTVSPSRARQRSWPARASHAALVESQQS